MNRPLVTLSVVALLALVVLATLYIQLGSAKEIVDRQLANTAARANKLSVDLDNVTGQNSALTARLAALESDLAATRNRLAGSEARAGQLDRDLAATKSLLAVQEQNARALANEVASLKSDLADARASGASPEAVAGYKHTIAELERQLAVSGNGAAAPTASGASTAVFASRSGRATVLSVGPESAFVVLDFGVNRGAQAGQMLTIAHGTESAATVLISDVRANYSIAQVQPDSLRGVLQKGDSAVLVR